MANYSWRKAVARCPFYHKSWDRGITCGSQNDNVRRRFRDEHDCAEHFRRFCACRYTKCQIYELAEKILK